MPLRRSGSRRRSPPSRPTSKALLRAIARSCSLGGTSSDTRVEPPSPLIGYVSERAPGRLCAAAETPHQGSNDRRTPLSDADASNWSSRPSLAKHALPTSGGTATRVAFFYRSRAVLCVAGAVAVSRLLTASGALFWRRLAAEVDNGVVVDADRPQRGRGERCRRHRARHAPAVYEASRRRRPRAARHRDSGSADRPLSSLGDRLLRIRLHETGVFRGVAKYVRVATL